jgi:hypothetical protein
MKKLGIPVLAIAAACATSLPARAEDPRPDENAMFGTPQPKTQSKDAFASGEVSDNALTIGGIFYQRFLLSGRKGGGVSGAPISAPLQFDGFLDGRPNDRLRAFVDARLFFDATRDSYSQSTSGGSNGSLQFSSASTAPTSFSNTSATPNNPSVSLDQAWLKFDMGRTVFGTVGKQHVKWGASRFWNPTDFLHVQRRDPLAPVDLRLGNTMAKFELPWELQHANFYAVVLFDNPQPASTLGQLGVALRTEKVWGDLEVGLDFVARGGLRPAYGVDASTSLGPFDAYLEAALLGDAPSPQYQVNSPLTQNADISALATEVPVEGPFVQVSGGLTHTFGWKENRQATIGAEYFYNQAGHANAEIYPVLIFYGQYQPFYTGRQYAALYMTAEGPDAEKRTSYTFSTLGNLSDKSFISRLDFSWRVLTYLTFESYADVHFGSQGGEFNFALSTPSLTYQDRTLPAVNIPATIFDLGLGLRMSL